MLGCRRRFGGRERRFAGEKRREPIPARSVHEGKSKPRDQSAARLQSTFYHRRLEQGPLSPAGRGVRGEGSSSPPPLRGVGSRSILSALFHFDLGDQVLVTHLLDGDENLVSLLQ